jgi:uncharacterized protein (TIGR00369 family)
MMDGSGKATSKATGMGDQQIGFERAAQVLAQQPLSVMLGATLLAIEPGHAELAVPIGENARQHVGIAHGGLIAFLADAAVTFAAGTVGGETVRTADLTIYYLRAASGEELVARAEVIHRGTRLIVCRCDLFDRREHGETYCAAAHGTVSAA